MLGLKARQLHIEADAQSETVWASLQGTACERVIRNQGGAAWVTPLCALPRDLFAWLGMLEVWDLQAGPKPFVFRQLGLTVHFGHVGDPIKPQAFRLEWPGVRDWTGAGPAFQAPGAGHPHWQIDILQSLERQNWAAEFTAEPAEIVEDFEAQPTVPGFGEVLRSITLESMHLASAARWWLPSTPGQQAQHINVPSDLNGLRLWLIESVLYVRQELKRCVLRA